MDSNGNCNGGPPTDAAVVTANAKAGQHVHIYVQHHGVADDRTDTKFTALEGRGLPAN
jgi:hypothetical protein